MAVMAEIDRRVWLVFDIVGLAALVLGTVMYFGMLGNVGDVPSLIVFAIGVIFVVAGAVFGYFEHSAVRKEFEILARARNVRVAAAKVPDDSDVPYMIDMTESWNAPLESEYDLEELMEGERPRV